MNDTPSAQELHNRVTRGLPLTTAEQARLNAWYVDQDQAEQSLLAQTNPTNTTDALQVEVQAALARLQTETQRVQELDKQNEMLRQEVSALKTRLRQSLPALTA